MKDIPTSQVRDSTRRRLLEKVRRNDIGKYLGSMKLEKVRSFRGDRITFEFPVTALIGPNGGGKSTILGAAACAYKSVRPGTFFPKSSVGDDSMSEWRIDYELIDKQIRPQDLIARTSKFRNRKWVRDELTDREVRYFGINRTVPAGERPKFKKLTKSSYVFGNPIEKISEDEAIQAAAILGKNLDEFKVTKFDGTEDFYIGSQGDIEYSEFHFGAGESSILRMISNIESAEDNSLILIEEIENGLHPVAVRRMVDYLLDVADRKSIQTIFTTHSDAALDHLPQEAIWAAIDGHAQQGVLSVETLRAIAGRVDQKLAVFVEDEFAKSWIESIIRERLGADHQEVGVYPLAGDGNAAKTHLAHNRNPAIEFSSLCFLDGDSQIDADIENGIFKLPGGQPESGGFCEVARRGWLVWPGARPHRTLQIHFLARL
jgi:AAA15 family ATPase/GTPase